MARCVYTKVPRSRYVVRLANGDRVQFTNPAHALTFVRRAQECDVYAGLVTNGMSVPRVGVRVRGTSTFDKGRTVR